MVKSLLFRCWASCVLLAATATLPASGASPVSRCQSELQRLSHGSGAEDVLRACVPLFSESDCQIAWTELLDTPRAPPGYGRAAGVARLAEGCEKAYCRFPGMGKQQLCTRKPPTPLSAEFFAAWHSFQTEVLRHEHVSSTTSERLAQALKLWAGFSPRSGRRHVLQVVAKPEVPGVVALTLWSAHGECLGAWVMDAAPDEATLRALTAAVPVPAGEAPPTVPCVRLEATGLLPAATTEAILHALRTVCPPEMVTVTGA